MRRLTLSEHTSRAYLDLPRPVAEAFAATGAVTATADLANRTVLTASSYVGTLCVGDVELRVTPKIGIHRLLWLLGYARDADGWRDDDVVTAADTDDLITAMAVSFLAAARRALAAGVLQGYRTTEEALPVLRGRLREADQLRARLGIAIPLEVRYDDYTIDIPENRLLVSAAARLLRLRGLPPAASTSLRRLLSMLADVTPLKPGAATPATTDTRLTHRYQPALRLARLVLAGRSLDQPPGAASASGFLFNLNTVFEDWLTTAMRHATPAQAGWLRAQYPDHLDHDQHISIKPDLVWLRDGRPVAVLDAKYKHTTSTDQPHGDLYQMLAYCTALRLPAGHLVYATGDAPRTYTIRHTGTHIHTWTLDLTQPTTDILNQVNRLANKVLTTHDTGLIHQLNTRPTPRILSR